jgi:NADPH-dependent 2,4-dienoyl-CoA reductase/sulfur reductase-like enzyme
MADAFWKSANTPVSSQFITGMPSMFSVPHYSKALNAIREEKGIAGEFNTNLIEVRPDDKVAVFEITTGDRKGERIEKEFGFLHVTPPMGPLDSVKSSPLADAAGWVNVDQGSLQHKKYENVFSLGDASSLPTSKVSTLELIQSVLRGRC